MVEDGRAVGVVERALNINLKNPGNAEIGS
jgi:hypothetical protein